ncbi:MAG: cobalamin biosynthesis protein CobM [Methanosphaera sp. rholeuAM74]|nr:MAG: cobalamin biosynthesis protein CobM [Methanosphaera sp. rholeuAM74]
MHLPDGIVPLNQAIVYWILTFIIISVFFYKFSSDNNKEKRIVSTAVFTVFVTLLSALSIPSPLGVPIHFFVIPLVVILLGPFTASIVSFVSLIIQALSLNMGGITSLGANFLVMGFIIAVTVHLTYKLLVDLNQQLSIFIATVIGIMFATFGQVIILLLTGAMNFNTLLATLIPFYLFISVLEGILNVLIINALKSVKPELLEISKI